MMQPWMVTVAFPVKVVPWQQNLKSPVCEFKSTTVFGLLSSCRQTSNTVTEKLHIAVFPAASVAVQVTIVEPVGRQEPGGGTQATCTPGQSSIAVGIV